MMTLSLSRFPSSFTAIKSTPFSFSFSFSVKMSSLTTNNLSVSAKSKLPILLFDVMDTIVRDPFYHHVPAFFRMSMKELLDSKHPTVWIDFEKGLIDEMELARNFFKDGRHCDIEGLKNCMKEAYSYIEGVEELLHDLKKNGYELHAFTNYPIWYQMIEEKLKLSNYLSWTFCSCVIGKRKPETDFYLEVEKRLGVDPANCVFIDDRLKNVDAAIEAGFSGLQFKNADILREELSSLLGINLLKDVQCENQGLTECSK